jgi:hypothetical protein
LVESSTDFLEALQDTNKSLTTGMTLPRTPNLQMPQKDHTTGGKKSKKKLERINIRPRHNSVGRRIRAATTTECNVFG